MRNILFDIIGNGIVNDEIVQTVKDKLFEKYQKSFGVSHFGKRFGTYKNDTVTTYCYPEDNKRLIFTCILNKDRVHFEDDYCLRNICYEIETLIMKEFEKIGTKSFSRINIIGKNKYNELVSANEFIENEENIEFLIENYMNTDILQKNIQEVVDNVKNKYKNIKCRVINYILEGQYYEELVEQIKEFPNSEDFEFDESKLKVKIEIV